MFKMLKISSLDLPALMEALPYDEVDHEPGEPEAAHQLPLDTAQPLLQPPVGHQNPITRRTTLDRDLIDKVATHTHVQYSSTGVVIVSFG